MLKLYRDIVNNHNAITTLVLVNLKTTVATVRLGWLWWVLDPLLMMTIYYFMVRIIFNRGGDNYHLFVLTGIIAWQFFSRALIDSTQSITRNRGLIRQIGIPIPILVAIPSVVQLFFAAIGIVIVMVWNYSAVGLNSIAVIPLLFTLTLLSYALGILLSVCEAYFKDTNRFISYFLRAGFFLSPVLYPSSRVLDSPSVPEFAKQAFQLNPMTWIIPAFRKILLEGVMFDWADFLTLFITVLFVMQLSLIWLRSNENTIVKML